MEDYKCKFNKRKCRTCVYHRTLSNRTICNFACVTGTTCLRKINGKVVDTRGDEYNNCKLYEKGASRLDGSERWKNSGLY